MAHKYLPPGTKELKNSLWLPINVLRSVQIILLLRSHLVCTMIIAMRCDNRLKLFSLRNSSIADRRDPKSFNLKVSLQFPSWLRSFSLSFPLRVSARYMHVFSWTADIGEKKTWHVRRSMLQVRSYRFEKELLIRGHDKTYLLLSANLPLVLSVLLG